MNATPSLSMQSMPRQTHKPVRRVVATLTAAIAALSLMAASALPARADDDLAKALIAALAIGAIVHSIDKGKAQPAPVAPPVTKVRNPRVPSVCAIEIAGTRRDVTVYPERCLRREGFDLRLPRQCAHQARVFGRSDRVYGEDCLRDAGFRMEDGRQDRGLDDHERHDREFRNHGNGHSRWRDRFHD